MTPAELKAARHALGLSAEGFARLGAACGAPIASSGRTVRRWEGGSQDIPGAVVLLTRILLATAEARQAIGLPGDLRPARTTPAARLP